MWHTSMVFARYLRAVVVLLATPTALYAECVNPTHIHMLAALGTVLGMIPASGWLHNETARWWAAADDPEPIPPPPTLPSPWQPPALDRWQNPINFFDEFSRR